MKQIIVQIVDNDYRNNFVKYEKDSPFAIRVLKKTRGIIFTLYVFQLQNINPLRCSVIKKYTKKGLFVNVR